MKSRLEKIGVVFGGCSTEYSISLESAYAVIRHLNPEKYLPVPIGISRTGDWFWYSGEPERIRKDEWQTADCVPAVLSVSRSAKGLLLLKPGGTELIPLDVLFPVLHGKNGEDGSVQGQAALAGIRLAAEFWLRLYAWTSSVRTAWLNSAVSACRAELCWRGTAGGGS